MKFVYKLFKYRVTTYCQGSADRGQDYCLLYVPEDASFNNNRSTLINRKHIDNYYEIDINSIEDMSIRF